MKRKIAPLLIVGILVLSGLGASAVTDYSAFGGGAVEITNFISLTFSPIIIEEYNDDYVEVNLEDTSSYLLSPGQPVLPKVIKSVELWST